VAGTGPRQREPDSTNIARVYDYLIGGSHALPDLSQPVALLLVAVPHFFPDEEDPANLVAVLRDALAPGSYLVISHATTDAQLRHVADAMAYYAQTTAPFRPHSSVHVGTATKITL
jgi:hypothetical protein